MSLHDPGRHEPLEDAAWDASRAREAIRGIVADSEEALGDGITWPWHPLEDAADAEALPKSLYLGSAGVLWALWYLAKEGAVALRIDPTELIVRVDRAYREKPDTGEVVPSYFVGEGGILLVRWRLTGSAEAADRLFASIRRNVANPTHEALWGAPGTMVGALHMLGWTGERRWHDLFVENAEYLRRTWLPSEHAPCHLWTQDLYGEIVQLLGAGHGFAGNAYPLLRGAALLPAEWRETLYDRCAATLRATAAVEGDCANWPPGVGPPRAGRTKQLVQWCHGAPGIVTGFAHFPPGLSVALDELLVQAGNMTWAAGPLAKGFGLCHGTAGNGYAFLALHRRTGDAAWLARARTFAMHAIGQCERMRRQYGRGRHSLWTGDPGLAVYLWHCLAGSGGLPGLDVLD